MTGKNKGKKTNPSNIKIHHTIHYLSRCLKIHSFNRLQTQLEIKCTPKLFFKQWVVKPLADQLHIYKITQNCGSKHCSWMCCPVLKGQDH